MTKKTPNKPNTQAGRLVDRKLEGLAQKLIRLSGEGVRITAAFLMKRISPQKYHAVETKIRQGYIENLERLRKLGIEHQWLSRDPAQNDGPPPLPSGVCRCNKANGTPYDTHCEARALGQSLLRLAHDRCRNIALCTRGLRPYQEYKNTQKTIRDRYINIMVRLWDVCNGSNAVPPEVWARTSACWAKT